MVELDNFSGPFDLLLGLISKHKLDITDVALARVTDEFVAHVNALSETSRADVTHGGSTPGKTLDELSSFVLVASTLLDLKTARLLPAGQVEDELDLELLEARDLLFARLLQYRAYKAVSFDLRERLELTGLSVGSPGNFAEEFRGVLPPLVLAATPDMLAALYATVLTRDTSEPQVAVDHLHVPTVSVDEQRTHVIGLLASRETITFEDLTASAESTLVVVARFLALLELFKAGAVTLDQDAPLGTLVISGRTHDTTTSTDSTRVKN